MISCHRLKLESLGDKMAIFISLPHTCSNCQSEGDTAVTVVMSSPVLWQHRTPPVSIPLRSLAFCVREERLQQMAAGVLVLTHCPHWITMSTELLYLCPCLLIKTATLSHISLELYANIWIPWYSFSVHRQYHFWWVSAALWHSHSLTEWIEPHSCIQADIVYISRV